MELGRSTGRGMGKLIFREVLVGRVFAGGECLRGESCFGGRVFVGGECFGGGNACGGSVFEGGERVFRGDCV